MVKYIKIRWLFMLRYVDYFHGTLPKKCFFTKIQNSYLCRPSKEGSVVQLVRMLPCHGRGRGFESRPVRRNQLSRACRGFLIFRSFPGV